MLRKTTAALFAAALGFMPQIVGAQEQEQPETTLKATNGAWEVRCVTAKPDACIMAQVGNRDDGKPVLRVSFRKTDGAKSPDGKPIAAVIQIDAPIGVLLPAGVEVKIDGREIGRAAFQVCDKHVCIASEPVPADFVNQMKNGAKAEMSIMSINGQKSDVSISLSGFTKSFDSL